MHKLKLSWLIERKGGPTSVKGTCVNTSRFIPHEGILFIILFATVILRNH